MHEFYMQQPFYMFFIESVVSYIMYKTEIVHKIYILYETYDCVLQYVQISAYNHNFHTNTHFINFHLHVFNMFKHVTLHVCLLNMFSMFCHFHTM